MKAKILLLVSVDSYSVNYKNICFHCIYIQIVVLYLMVCYVVYTMSNLKIVDTLHTCKNNSIMIISDLRNAKLIESTVKMHLKNHSVSLKERYCGVFINLFICFSIKVVVSDVLLCVH